MQRGVRSLLLVFVSGVFLAACEGTIGTVKDETATTSGSAGSASTAGGSATSSGMSSGGAWTGHPLDDPDSPLSNRTFYFEFDESEILPADRPILEAHAKYLSENPSASVTLEGHADERGTREYNMGLGERRATSVRQFMTLLGAAGQQVRTISYGEERPAAMGHNEEAWALNRRVELIYRTR